MGGELRRRDEISPALLKAIEEPDLETKHHLDGAWTSLICTKPMAL
jgi:hypothetical protein